MDLDTNTVFLFYFMFILFIITTYIYAPDKLIVKDIVAILSGTTIALGLFNYVGSEKERNSREKKENKLNYINNVSSIFNKIDTMYLQYPEQLHDLYYEFYGYNNFPIKYTNDKETGHKYSQSSDKPNDNKSNDITSIEYITINIIIEYVNNIYITNTEIFEDLNFRNKIMNYLRSNKFKQVLSYTKNNYSPKFIRLLNDQSFITDNELRVESIDIPSIKRAT